MVYPHISLTSDIDAKIREYAEKNKIRYSQAINILVERGLTKENFISTNDLINGKVDAINNKQIYLIKLVEQFYSDMEIENITNPNNNKSLQSFKNKKYKDLFND